MKRFLFLCSILLSFVSTYAEVVPYAGEFMRLAGGVRELTLGGVPLSFRGEPALAVMNPVAVSPASPVQLFIMHQERYDQQLTFDHLAITSHLREYQFVFSLLRLGVDGIPDTRNALIDYGADGVAGSADEGEGNGELDYGERLNPGAIKRFGTSEWAGFFTISSENFKGFQWGASLKLIRKNLLISDSYGIGMDLGFRRPLIFDIISTLVIRDLFTTFIFWSDGKLEQIAPSSQLAFSRRFVFQQRNLTLIPLLAVEINRFGRNGKEVISTGNMGVYLRYGVELVINQLLAFRVGRNDLGYWGFGIGLETDLIDLDYGLLPASTGNVMGDSHLVSLNIHLRNLIEFLSR